MVKWKDHPCILFQKINKVRAALLQKERCGKYPFQVTALTFSMLSPYQSRDTSCKGQASWCSCSFPCLAPSTQQFSKQVPTRWGKMRRDSISRVTDSSARTDSLINQQKRWFWSFLLGVLKGLHKKSLPLCPPWFLPEVWKEIHLLLQFTFTFLCFFGLVELLFVPKCKKW